MFFNILGGYPPGDEILKILHTFDHLLGLCHLHGEDISLSHLLSDILGYFLGNSLSRHLGDSLLSLCRLHGYLLGDTLSRFLGDGLGRHLSDALSHSHLLVGPGLGHLLGYGIGHHLLSE